MTIGRWLELAKQQISTLDAELILLFGLREVLLSEVDRSYLVAHPEVEISRKNWERLEALLTRRAEGEPLAYILGSKEFYGRDFRVNSTVLIPRPETESLVELTKETSEELGKAQKAQLLYEQGLAEKRPESAKKCQILEIGTGSGCLAVTLSLEIPEVEVVATDVSEEALAVAQANNSDLDGKVQFLRSDLLKQVPKTTNFAILVANLPYVDPEWGWLERKSLDFEPKLALYAEEKGLKLYRELLDELAERSLKPRFLVFEADPCQHQALIVLAARRGYKWRKTADFGLLLENAAEINEY